ncbi:MAG TPA: serine hydrolase domain-containing protein [Gemmatimonadales bacterium]|nr:serine hydrolase domain-containing protein [Gemmatimonadales bacterium]
MRVCAALLALCALGGAASPVNAQRFAAVDAAVREGIDRGLYPGAVVLIGRRDSVLYAKGYGHMTWSRKSPVPDPDSTLWDLASISKVVGTTSAIMRLVDAGAVDLDAPVSRYLPRFAGGEKNRVTVRMLLDHTSGLPPYIRLYRLARTRAQAIDRLFAEPLRRTPGDTAEYSDLNAMLLGLLVEEVSGEPLDRFTAREVFEPLGMHRTMYRPPAALHRWTVPTSTWRGRPVRGEVNDQNAARLGGVAGHAGLFSSARDLGRYAQTWLRNGVGPKGAWVSPATLRLFLTPGPRSGTRLLGWDSPDPAATPDAPSVFGNLISPSAYGHTGWTGTELWVDPARDLFVVFLTNRSYDPRARRSIEQLKFVRAQLSDAALRSVPVMCQVEVVVRC